MREGVWDDGDGGPKVGVEETGGVERVRGRREPRVRTLGQPGV